jgi:hypothetical protein
MAVVAMTSSEATLRNLSIVFMWNFSPGRLSSVDTIRPGGLSSARAGLLTMVLPIAQPGVATGTAAPKTRRT